jgi:hypothetical protein
MIAHRSQFPEGAGRIRFHIIPYGIQLYPQDTFLRVGGKGHCGQKAGSGSCKGAVFQEGSA